MVVGHNLRSNATEGFSSKRDVSNGKNTFSVSVTGLNLPNGELKIDSEMEASGKRIDMDQAREDENHNQEILNHKKYIPNEATCNEEDIDRASEVDEEAIGTSMDDYETHLHPVTRSIFQQLSTSNEENVERARESNSFQLYMPNAIRSSRMRRLNYSPWGYDAPAHGDIINISRGKNATAFNTLYLLNTL